PPLTIEMTDRVAIDLARSHPEGAMASWRRRWPGPCVRNRRLQPQSHQPRAGTDHRNSEPIDERQALPEKHDTEDSDQHHTELVERSHSRGIGEAQSTEVAKPGSARGEPGEHQKKI